MQDGHGILEQEQMREINGNGIKGISFALSEEQFHALQSNYQKSMQAERDAIKELNQELTKKGLAANGCTRFALENEKAQKEQRTPRLKPFQIAMLKSSNRCII